MLTKFLSVLVYLIFTTLALAESFVGRMEALPDSVVKVITGTSWRKGCPMPLEKLSYLTLSYWGFDKKPHEGHLIVLNTLAGETLQIFHELFELQFPIERMELPENFLGKNEDWRTLDERSAEHNNTYGFFCRDDSQTPGQLSAHSYGIALDINPLYNPAYVANQRVVPSEGKKYFDRSLKHPAFLDTRIAEIFAKHGWKWGGFARSDILDYMHVAKDIDAHYICPSLQIYTTE